jgi:outer membrane lipoprotein-sorting protein
MRKMKVVFVCIVALCIMLSACASKETELPEMVRAVQHKIDKALESEPTYSDLLEI